VVDEILQLQVKLKFNFIKFDKKKRNEYLYHDKRSTKFNDVNEHQLLFKLYLSKIALEETYDNNDVA
jgi:hypothetical protein